MFPISPISVRMTPAYRNQLCKVSAGEVRRRREGETDKRGVRQGGKGWGEYSCGVWAWRSTENEHAHLHFRARLGSARLDSLQLVYFCGVAAAAAQQRKKGSCCAVPLAAKWYIQRGDDVQCFIRNMQDTADGSSLLQLTQFKLFYCQFKVNREISSDWMMAGK